MKEQSKESGRSNGRRKSNPKGDSRTKHKGGKYKPPFPRQDDAGSRFQRREEEASNEDAKTARNDVSWYTRYPQVIKDASAISFGTPVGKPYPMSYVELDTALNPISGQYTAPGIARINWVPGIGVSLDKNSPINRGAWDIYVAARSKLKTANDYDASDMMMALIAVDSAFMLHKLAQRAYGIMMIPNPPENYYYVRSLLAAVGFDPDDFQSNIAQYRMYLNTTALALNRYALPSSLTFADRHTWMCENLYCDADSIKAQIYAFVPEFVYKYDNTVTTGSQLTPVPLFDTLMTFANYVETMEALLTAFLGDNDVANISGDLQNAYGSSAFRVCTLTDEGYVVTPKYEPEVLNQITNIKFCGEWLRPDLTNFNNNMAITQNPAVNEGAIIWNPRFVMQSQGNSSVDEYGVVAHDPLLNLHVEQNADNIIVGTRLTPVISRIPAILPNGSDPLIPTCILEACGSEVCTTFQIYNTVYSKPFAAPVKMTNCVMFNTSSSSALVALYTAIIADLQSFDWAWEIEVFNKGSDATSFGSMFWDVENVAVAKAEYVVDMHRIALLSEFDMPDLS